MALTVQVEDSTNLPVADVTVVVTLRRVASRCHIRLSALIMPVVPLGEKY